MKPTFFHTATCPQCKAVEILLKKSNIEYDSCLDVEEMKKKGITHTPALEVGGKILYGKPIFDYIKNGK